MTPRKRKTGDAAAPAAPVTFPGSNPLITPPPEKEPVNPIDSAFMWLPFEMECAARWRGEHRYKALAASLRRISHFALRAADEADRRVKAQGGKR